MRGELFLLALFSHNLFDFVFQINFFRENRFPPSADHQGAKIDKRKIILKTIKGNLFHSLSHFCGLFFITLLVNLMETNHSEFPLIKIILISLIHFFIDEGKSLLYLYRTSTKDNIYVFFTDQAIHLLVLILLVFDGDLARLIISFKLKILSYPTKFSFLDKLLITVNIFILCTWVMGIFVKIFINHLSSNAKTIPITDTTEKNIIDRYGNIIRVATSEAKNGGYTIGILERILILISIVMNCPSMIGFVLTAKSVARLKKLSNDSFAEYFIIGTFFSFIAAIVGGLIIRSLFIN